MISKIVLRCQGLRKIMFLSLAILIIGIFLLGAFILCRFTKAEVKKLSYTTRLEERRQEVSFHDYVIETGKNHDAQPLDRAEKYDREKTDLFIRPVKIGPIQTTYATNFRRLDADTWDTNPEYEFQAFSRRFHIVLLQESKFMHPNLKLTVVSRNSTTQHQLKIDSNCYYAGYLKDDFASHVTVNLCNGMRGHIRLSKGGIYTIEPTDSVVDKTEVFDHILKQITDQNYTNHGSRNHCATETEPLDHINNHSETVHWCSNGRCKRSVDDVGEEYTIELLLAIDRKVANFHNKGLEEYISTIVREVNQLFKDNTIDNSINVVLVKWVQLEDDLIIRDSEHDNTVMLDLFCHWQFQFNNHDDDSPDHYDAAILITRDMICSYDRSQCEPFLGLAQLGHVCSNNGMKSCGAVKDNGLNTAFTVAHELGHILDIPHDEDARCAPYRIINESMKIMTQKSNPVADPWTWSSCSRHFLNKFLESPNVECLYDNPLRNKSQIRTSSVVEYPGQLYSVDKQCEMIYGEGWKMIQKTDNCSMLWCHNPSINQPPRSETGPWADGTECGPNHWCRRKRCVPRTPLERKVHGGWSEWQPYGECTKPCGGGVQKSKRACNNPVNSNGGNFCKGSKVRYETCNMQECPPRVPDIHLRRCAKLNNESDKWVPYYRQNLERDKCILVCRETNVGKVQSLNEYVTDGTFCDEDFNYGVCINGKCIKTGCDHKLHSNMKFDNCGTCGGNNSTCKLVYKTFTKKTEAGYTFMDTIPAGASNIDIQQYSHNGSLDDYNYLALRDPLTKAYILNGEYSLCQGSKEIIFNRIMIKYGGTLANPERIKISNRLSKDLVLEILSSSNAPPFKIICQYILPMVPTDSFKWEETNKWTKCDSICNGKQEKLIHCIKKETGNAVYSESCLGLPKPPADTRNCNMFCILSWKAVGQTECSTSCGQGTRNLIHRCYQENYSNSTSNAEQLELMDSYCAHISKPSKEELCLGPCIDARWRDSNLESCSETCSQGIEKRWSTCVDNSDKQVDKLACFRKKKRAIDTCHRNKCPHWARTEWSPCSVTCGKGFRKRVVHCKQNKRIVPLYLCRNLVKPRIQKSCQMPICAVLLVSKWSQEQPNVFPVYSSIPNVH